MRVLIIHNDASGFGSDAIFEFQRALLREGDECVMRLLTKDAPDRGYSLLEDAESFDLVVISGGDGTVASLLYHLRRREVLTCVFPSGTANLFFANLGNASEPSALARACRVGHSTQTDLGEMLWIDERGRRHREGFCLMAGIGFDAQIMQAAIPAKRTMGQAAYFAAAIANPKPTVQRFRITVDGKTVERMGIGCLVANNAMMQGNIEIVPNCSMSDGLLDVIMLEVNETAQLLRPIFAGLMDRDGKHSGRPHIARFTGRDIVVRAIEPMQMEIDGDPIPGTVRSFRARVLPKSNRLIVDKLSRYDEQDNSEPLFGGTEEIAFPY
ncbi:MAG: diacylglycerol kinase family protein [Coriobacteriales bacterium]|nr:diacylglycerol kinase family protein [Coriobacteriales bacterium]